MGKGNRSRIERAMNESAKESKNVQAKKSKVSGAGIFVAVAAILVVVALLIGAIGVVNDRGWFARTKNVVTVEGANGEVFEVDGAMMTYFFTTQFNNIYQTYYQMLSSYASGSDVNSMVYQYMGIADPNKSLKDQNMKGAEGADPITAFDYYMNLTEQYVTRMLTYCQFASKAGLALTDEDKEEINHTLEELKKSFESEKAMYDQYAALGLSISYPYKNFNEYLAGNYGAGVNERDVRNCLELVTLAAKFEEKLNDEKKQAILGDKANTAVEEYVKENPAAFLMADYYSYAFSVSNKGKTDAEFEADKKEMLEKAQNLAKAEGKEAFKAAVIDLLVASAKENYRDTNWNKYLKENNNDETLANEALEKYFNETYTDEKKNEMFEDTLTEGFKYPTTHTDLSKWIFGYEATACKDKTCSHTKEEDHEKDVVAAKPGDITYFENTSTKEETVKKEETTTAGTTAEETTTDAAAPASEEATTKEETTTKAPTSTSTGNKVKVTTYTVTVYLLEKEAYRNTEITKHFGYVMFAAKADAEKFYAEFSKGDMNKDTLVETVEKMHEELKPFAYDGVEDYLVGDLEDQNVQGADKWLRDAKAGTCSGVTELTYATSTTVDGKPKDPKTYYSVLVYDQDGYEAWYSDALTGATVDAMDDWFEENGLELTFDEASYKYIKA